jgi:LmbE family N-acetylglucosaminyl deacetylase
MELDWGRTLLVVAHLDDEVLWFSSIAGKVASIVVCFLGNSAWPEWGPGRLKSLDAYPLENIRCLGVDESDAFDSADWLSPTITPYGIDPALTPLAKASYEEAFSKIKSELTEALDGYTNVITHNPWGEYGHEEHILVHRVIETLQPDFGYRIWFDNYFSNRSIYLMQQLFIHLSSTYSVFDTNAALGIQAKELLMRNHCWTWYDDWQWYPKEAMISNQTEKNTKPRWSPYPPLNPLYIDLPFRKPEYKRPLVDRVRSRLIHLFK